MTARPGTVPLLDTNSTNRTIPAGGVITDGYLLNGILPAANMNFLVGGAGDWLEWLDERSADGGVSAQDLTLQGVVGTAAITAGQARFVGGAAANIAFPVGGASAIIGGAGHTGGVGGAGGVGQLVGGAGGGSASLGGNAVVTGGAGAGTSAGGSATITGGAGGATGAGGTVVITGGTGSSTSTGSAVSMTAGDGGGTSGAGGVVSVAGGAAQGGNDDGGVASLTGGAGDGTGEGGNVNVTGGAGGSVVAGGGIVTISGGLSGGTGPGGNINILGGDAGSGGDGGTITLQSGDDGVDTAAKIFIDANKSTNHSITLTAGDGGSIDKIFLDQVAGASAGYATGEIAQIRADTGNTADLVISSTTLSRLAFGNVAQSLRGGIDYTHATDLMQFFQSNNEAMRLSGLGDLSLNTTGSSGKFTVLGESGSGTAIVATGGTANGHGIETTGDGTGEGIQATGGDSSGCGVIGTGGAPNGGGIVGNGTGTGGGVAGIATNGRGVVAQSDTTSPARGAFRVVPQDTQPTGANLVGDMYVTTAGVLKINTVAGTPGTWVSVGAQT